MNSIGLSPTVLKRLLGALYCWAKSWGKTYSNLLSGKELQCILCLVLPSRVISSIQIFFFVLLLGVSFGQVSLAQEIDLGKIAQLESSHNPKAIGDGGKALGLFQLHKGVIEDYNKAKHTAYSHSDALEPARAQVIAKWYLDSRIPQILRSKRLNANLRNVLVCWNAGCGRVANPPASTLAYIRKYEALHG